MLVYDPLHKNLAPSSTFSNLTKNKNLMTDLSMSLLSYRVALKGKVSYFS